jgi:hypothetical protein
MNVPTTIETVVIALAVIAFVTYRLRRWQTVNLSRMLTMPLILVVLGVASLAGPGGHLPRGWHLGFLDIAILGFELAVGLVVGWIIGRLTEIRTTDGVTRSRVSYPGLAVWLGFVALRIGLGVAASMLGASLAAMPAMTIFVVALIKGVQVLLVRERVIRHADAERARSFVGTGF